MDQSVSDEDHSEARKHMCTHDAVRSVHRQPHEWIADILRSKDRNSVTPPVSKLNAKAASSRVDVKPRVFHVCEHAKLFPTTNLHGGRGSTACRRTRGRAALQ